MLFPRSRTLNIALSLLVLSSMMLSGLAVEARATDLVPESDLAGGASVFVFRKSRKVPQERAAARSFMAGGAAATGCSTTGAGMDTAWGGAMACV